MGELQNIAGVNGYNKSVIDTEHAFFLEVFGTLFLLLTVLSTINEERGHAPSYLQPLSIGLAILVMHIFLVSTTVLTYLILHDPIFVWP